MKYLYIDYENAGSPQVIDAVNDEAIPLEALEMIDQGCADIFKVEVDATGVLQFRRAILDVEDEVDEAVEEGAEEEGEAVDSHLVIGDWELVTAAPSF